MQFYLRKRPAVNAPCATHARPPRSLTEPMQPGARAPCYHGCMRLWRVPGRDGAAVVAVAATGYRPAGFLAAASAAAWFDFFLTRPYERFTITRREDIETTVLLLVLGIAVTEIAVWGRRQHAAASRRAGYLDGINA